MGIVYRATGPGGGEVALKVLTCDADSALGVQRFVREATTMASLSHPAVVHVLEAGDVNGLPYYTMDLLHGVNLCELVKQRGAQSLERVTLIVRQLANALAAAHAQDLVHRDVKPGNVMVNPARADLDPKLIDFGLVLAGSEDDRITLDGSVVGTPGFLPPEGLMGARALSSASDVFGLALVALYLLAGYRIFETPKSYSLAAHAAARSRAFARLNTVKAPLLELLWEMLHFDPDDRPTMSDVLAQLQRSPIEVIGD